MHRRKQRIGNGDIPGPEPPERSHYRRRNRRRDFAHVKPAGIPAQKGLALHLQPQAHPAGTIQQPFQGPSYRHRPGFSQAHQHRHQTHDAAFPAIRLAPLHGTHARREPVAPEFYLDGRTGTERLRDGLFERDHRRTDRRDDLQGRGHPDPLPHGASRGRQPDTQPCGGVFQAVHRAARRTLQARTQRGILRPAAMHHAQIPHHAHQAHQRQIGIGMDRQLRDP